MRNLELLELLNSDKTKPECLVISKSMIDALSYLGVDEIGSIIYNVSAALFGEETGWQPSEFATQDANEVPSALRYLRAWFEYCVKACDPKELVKERLLHGGYDYVKAAQQLGLISEEPQKEQEPLMY